MLSRTKLDAKLRLCEEVAADRCRIRVYIRQVPIILANKFT